MKLRIVLSSDVMFTGAVFAQHSLSITRVEIASSRSGARSARRSTADTPGARVQSQPSIRRMQTGNLCFVRPTFISDSVLNTS